MNSCTNCGQSLRPGARFCGACGTPQTPQAESPRERLPRKPSSDSSPPPEVASDQRGFLLVAGLGVLVLLLLGGGLWWWMLSPSSEVVEEALGTATVLISTAVPEADLEAALEEARETVERNPKLTTVLNELLIVYEQDGFDAALAFAREKELVDEEGYLPVVLVLDVDESTAEGQQVIETLQSELESKEVIVEGTLFEEMTIRIPVEKAMSEGEEAEEADSLLDDFTQLEHVQHLRLPTIMLENGDGVVGEGVSVSNADEWHEAGFRGQGVKVGVIDLGFEGYEELLGNGLPANVHLAPNFELGNHPHGTAVGEIVHEMAPEAELYFAIGDRDVQLNNAAKWMADNGVQVINYSAGGSAGPFDGTNISARIVNQMAERGILWVNSAGNSAESHWSDTFRDEDNNGLHEFAAGLELLPIQGLSVILSWWEGNREANYDLCLFDESGSTLITCSVDTQSAESGIDPVEGIRLQRGDIYQVAIALDESAPSDEASPLELFVQRGDVHPDFQVAEGSLTNPADASGALAVGAVEWQDDKLADYSSQGPTADGRNKPELSAPSHVQSASYPESPPGFNGTSAAAPHVAGAAALVLSAFPEMNRDELADYLISHATDLGPRGYDLGYGEGRLDLGSPPEAPPPAASTPTTIAATPATSAAFNDDFSDSESGLPHQASDEGWSSTYEDGMYVMTAEFFPFGSSWERYQGLDFDDFTLNVEAERLEGMPSDYYGVVFRAQDDDNYHLFQLSELGLARWQQVVDGEMESLVEAKIITVNNNKANQITIEAHGQQLTVSVNGEEVHTIDNDPIGHGSIGFIVTNQGLPFTAGFDNLSVTP